MLFGMTWYQILMYFAIYSVGGWIVEVFYHALCVGVIVNRGFLNGPVCPIYGVGAVSVFSMTNLIGTYVTGTSGHIEDTNLLVLLLGGMAVATLIELIGGAVLDMLFHMRWWDYSDEPFNFKGYICLKFSVIWGIGIGFVVRILQPVVREFTTRAIPSAAGWIMIVIFYAAFAADLVITVLTINKMNRELAELERVRASLRKISDGMTDAIGKTSQVIGESRVQAALAKAELKDAAAEAKEELWDAAANARADLKDAAASAKADLMESAARQRAELEERAGKLTKELSRGTIFGTGRILRALPDIRHRDYGETLAELRKKISENLPKKGGKSAA